MLNHLLIKKGLREQAAKINNLLSKEVPIKLIPPLAEEKAIVTSNKKFYAKILCQDQPTPLRTRINVVKNIGATFAYFSVRSERPTKLNNDKMITLRKGETYSSFSGNQERQLLFTKNFIYITIESEKEAHVIFQSNFGKSSKLIFIC